MKSNTAGRRTQRGSSVLYVIVLSPLILLSLALALEAGALQMQRERLRSAADMATITAGSAGAVVDAGASLDSSAVDAALRLGLEDNLTPLQDDIVGSTPRQVALSADVIVVTSVPAVDPLDPSRTLTRPTVETRFGVPVRSGLLAIAGLPPSLTMTVTSRADLRVIGGAQT